MIDDIAGTPKGSKSKIVFIVILSRFTLAN